MNTHVYNYYNRRAHSCGLSVSKDRGFQRHGQKVKTEITPMVYYIILIFNAVPETRK